MRVFSGEEITLKKALPFILIIAGVIGTAAAFALTYDKIQILKDPAYQPGCNINPIFSCVSVMETEQASLLGVPNPIFGLMGFTALTTLGFLLVAGAQLKKWSWQAIQIAATGGVIFMHYLFFQAVYRIGAICPWCFVVWVVTIPAFWYITLFNLREGYIQLPTRIRGVNPLLQRNHGNILVLWYAMILGVILYEFWYYWSTVL